MVRVDGLNPEEIIELNELNQNIKLFKDMLNDYNKEKAKLLKTILHKRNLTENHYINEKDMSIYAKV